MQLNTILHLTGELLQASAESPSGDSPDADALLPFAAVLSGAFSLVAPTPEASEGGSDASEATPQPLPHAGLEEIHLAERVALDAEASATPPLAAEASLEGVVLDPIPTPDGDALQGARPEPGAARRNDAPPVIVEENPQVKTIHQGVETDGKTPVRQGTQVDAEVLAEEIAPSDQDVEIKTNTASASADDEASSAHPDVLRRPRQGARPSTAGEKSPAPTVLKTTASRMTSTIEQPAEPVPQAAGQQVEKAVLDGTTAAEIDGAAPDLDGAAQEKTTGSSSDVEADAVSTRAEGEDSSSDAGDDHEGRREDTRRARSARRRRGADAEPSVVRKTEEPSIQGARRQETTPLDAASSPESAPEPTDPTLASPDLDPGLALAEEHAARTTTERTTSDISTGRTRAARGGLAPNRVVPAAWLRAVLGNARQSVFADGGWKVLEMNLDEGDGTVTIKARREEGRVAVAVGFSDPELRALASAHADRLQEVLQTEYETTVDFSLFSDDAGDSGDRQQSQGAGPAIPGAAATDGEGAIRDDRPSRRSLPAGAQHEWVG